MKVLRKICRVCGDEEDERSEEENLNKYEEKIKYIRHKSHPKTVEDKLLEGIFSEEEWTK